MQLNIKSIKDVINMEEM